MRETVEEAAERFARLMTQGSAVITWKTDPKYTAVGVAWADRSDTGTAWAEGRR